MLPAGDGATSTATAGAADGGAAASAQRPFLLPGEVVAGGEQSVVASPAARDEYRQPLLAAAECPGQNAYGTGSTALPSRAVPGLRGSPLSRRGKGEMGPTSNPRRVLGAVSVAAITFFNVCGGPWGSEEIVSDAGPLPGLIGVVVFATVWGLPLASITAELSSAFPDDGGCKYFCCHKCTSCHRERWCD